MHPTAAIHRPCFTITSTAAPGNSGHPFDYSVSMTSGDEGEVHLSGHGSLRDAVKALEAVETAVDTVLDLLARQGALIKPAKVELVFERGESYLGEEPPMTASEAACAGRMGVAAVSGMAQNQLRAPVFIPGFHDPDPAVHAAVREAQARMLAEDQAAFEREALQDQAAEGAAGFPMAPMEPR